LKSVLDDGIVVVLWSRLNEMPRTIGRRHDPGRASAAIDESGRRIEIIEEEYLRLQVAREAELKKENPALWRKIEQARLQRNRKTESINKRLRAERLRPMELEPSLDQRVKKLKQLEARAFARSATKKAGR
jgi:hypothetical protein